MIIYKIKDRRLAGFNSIFAVSSIDVAKKYYAEFKKLDIPYTSLCREDKLVRNTVIGKLIEGGISEVKKYKFTAQTLTELFGKKRKEQSEKILKNLGEPDLNKNSITIALNNFILTIN